MAKQIIDIGQQPNDNQGDPLRTSFIKVNENFDEMYSNTSYLSEVLVADYDTTNAAFDHANSIAVSANSYAGAMANAANAGTGTAANLYAQAVGAAANSTANGQFSSVNSYISLITDNINSYIVLATANANLYAQAVGAAANATANGQHVSINSYIVLATANSNLYAQAVGAASNNWANDVGAAANSTANGQFNSINSFITVITGNSNSYVDASTANANLYAESIGAAANATANSQHVSINSYISLITGNINSYIGLITGNVNSYIGLITGNVNSYISLITSNVNSYIVLATANANLYAESVGAAANATANGQHVSINSYVSLISGNVNSYIGLITGNVNSYVALAAGNANLYSQAVGAAANATANSGLSSVNSYIGLITGNVNSYVALAAGNANLYSQSVGAAANTTANGQFASVNSYVSLITGNVNSYVALISGNVNTAVYSSLTTYYANLNGALFTGPLSTSSDLWANGGFFRVSTATFNIANVTATTVNAFGGATFIRLGSSTGNTTFAHSVVVTGTGTFSGNLTSNTHIIKPVDGLANGGALYIQGAASFPHFQIAANSNQLNVFSTNANNMTLAVLATAGGTATFNVGIGRTVANYPLDVIGTINASNVLINQVPLPTNTVSTLFLGTANNANYVGGVGSSNIQTAAIEYVIDGGGSVISLGQKGHIEVPFNCTINNVTILLDQSGSINVEIQKDTYANFPPTASDTINASGFIVSAATNNKIPSSRIATTTITAGDILAYNVVTVATATRATVSIQVTKN